MIGARWNSFKQIKMNLVIVTEVSTTGACTPLNAHSSAKIILNGFKLLI